MTDMGRMVLEIQVEASLRQDARLFDVPAIVEDVVRQYGFVDIAELPPTDYLSIVMSHRKPAS